MEFIRSFQSLQSRWNGRYSLLKFGNCKFYAVAKLSVGTLNTALKRLWHTIAILPPNKKKWKTHGQRSLLKAMKYREIEFIQIHCYSSYIICSQRNPLSISFRQLGPKNICRATAIMYKIEDINDSAMMIMITMPLQILYGENEKIIRVTLQFHSEKL